MFQDAYAFHNLEVDDRHTHSYNTRQLGGISKGIIFLTFRIKLLEKQLYWHVFFNLWSLLTCLVVRALVWWTDRRSNNVSTTPWLPQLSSRCS
uniref:Sodium:hydrogen exchanger 2 (Nhe2) n=1 Tax=Echinococcus granulosus TaxID=6210 RepID=A0A068WSB2_ECHGR|nr:sodium:hydrogen exchanger 2 (nhe2) [Echinococcus granulosus]